MDINTLNTLYALLQKSARDSWKASIEALANELRPYFVFDNMAVFIVDPKTKTSEVAYARALGRGKTAEADAAWGDRIAAEVIVRGEAIIQIPKIKADAQTDRLRLSHLLGLPLRLENEISGAVVFIRFGGPAYNEEHVATAALVAMWLALLFERRNWHDTAKQLQDVQRRIRLQDDFLATISHELRTPLGFIKGYSTTLLRQDTSWDENTQREFLTIIDEEADRLTQLIDDLLESARLQSNTLPMKFQPLRLDGLIRDATLRLKQRHPSLLVSLDFGTVPPIHADSVHLGRVIENLFSNAVKYAPGSPLEVTLRQTGDKLLFRLTDHGPGIPEKHLPMIFERFYRVPSDSNASAGTGLGLYICRQIILAHHGKIWAESKLKQGTTFLVELSIRPPG
ncbi:MAG: Adaptive-response sensory-kinase SasA [Anaerolineales bacterium]|nr:Adaptive-response sensory-kinase SasA [Anaerolineales bacterium]